MSKTKIVIGKEPFEGWVIKSELGKGSFGTVFLAEKDGGYSAIKQILIPTDDEAVGKDKREITDYYKPKADRMRSEITIMLKLEGNPGVVSYKDHKFNALERGGWEILIRMEYLKPLSTYINENGLRFKEILSLGINLCGALEECKNKGIIHRDIKEANILVDERGLFKLGDFGVAKNLEGRTHGNTRMGTLETMAPEVDRGEDHNHRADIYSFGIVLYKLLNQRRIPFMPQDGNNDDYENSLKLLKNGKLIPELKTWGTNIDELLRKACAFKPEDRYSSFKEMEEALIKIKDGCSNEVLQQYALHKDIKRIPKVPIDIPIVPKNDPLRGTEDANNNPGTEPEEKPIVLKGKKISSSKFKDKMVIPVVIIVAMVIVIAIAVSIGGGKTEQTAKLVEPIVKSTPIGDTKVTPIVTESKAEANQTLPSDSEVPKQAVTEVKPTEPQKVPSQEQTKQTQTLHPIQEQPKQTQVQVVVQEKPKQTQTVNPAQVTKVAPTSVITFPDEYLEKAIRDAIEKPTGDILKDDVKKIVSLSTRGSNIVSLSGIENLTNLTYLDLTSNQISNIEPLKGLTNLNALGLATNKISNIEPLKGLTNLTSLYLFDNQISSIEVLKGLTNLNDLNLYLNQISNIEPLKGLTNLNRLYLSCNKINNIEPLKGLTNLINLTLDSNQINDYTPTNSYYKNLTIKDFTLP